MTPLHARGFPHRLVVVTMDPLWTTRAAAATVQVLPSENFWGFIRVSDGAGFRYAFVAGRHQWIENGQPVVAGILYEVSPRLRMDPRSFPSDSRRFREIGEVAVANDPAVFDVLHAGYGPSPSRDDG